MAKWLGVMIQAGEGCDYTIGCGYRVVEVEADSEKDARVKLSKALYLDSYIDRDSGEDPSYYIDGEGALESVKIYKVAKEIDLMPLLEKAQERFNKAEEDEEKNKRREEYEKLRKEFGD